MAIKSLTVTVIMLTHSLGDMVVGKINGQMDKLLMAVLLKKWMFIQQYK